MLGVTPAARDEIGRITSSVRKALAVPGAAGAVSPGTAMNPERRS
jgi:hypothetical protein